MYKQDPKTEIDVGDIGNASTGDILYDGGIKLNSNFMAVYNSFGDQRYYDAGTQVGNQTIYATGYYQKVDQYAFNTPLAMGTMWDVDTTLGGANPILAAGKPGEAIYFINSNGSCSVNNPIEISVTGGSFVGVSGSLVITNPFSKVECWCISNEGGVAVWNYSISSLFGSSEVPVEISTSIPTGGLTLPIAHSSEYVSLKLLITASSIDGSVLRQSENNILVDKRLKNILSTEFGVLRVGNTNEGDEIIDIKYTIGIDGTINMGITTTHQNMRISVKSIAVQRVGSA